VIERATTEQEGTGGFFDKPRCVCVDPASTQPFRLEGGEPSRADENDIFGVRAHRRGVHGLRRNGSGSTCFGERSRDSTVDLRPREYRPARSDPSNPRQKFAKRGQRVAAGILTKQEKNDEEAPDSPPRSTRVIATVSSLVTVASSEWMCAAGGVTGRVMSQLVGRSGNLSLTPRVRFAAVTTDTPDAWADFGLPQAANGIVVTDTILSTPTNKMWVQFGLGGAAATGVGEGEVTFQSSMVGNGAPAGATVVSLPAGLINASSTGVYPVGAPIPAVGLTGLMYAYVFSGVGSSGALAGGACARLIIGDPKAPSVWSNLTSGAFSVTASTSTQELNSLVLAPPVVAGALLIQPGIFVTGSNPQAQISVLVAAIYG
jgi:hypothetical protein